MAGKSTLPLLAFAGIAAVVLTKGKKKKKKKEVEEEMEEELEFPKWIETAEGEAIGDLEVSPEGQAKMVFDEACQAFADRLNVDAHNTYLTGSFHTLYKSGVRNAEQIVQAMLRDQAPQCPWDNPEAYTPLMKGVHDQLLAAIADFARMNNYELS